MVLNFKIRLYMVADEDARPELVSPVFCQTGDTYADLRLRLEKGACVDWPFRFWDLDKRCRIPPKFEAMNPVCNKVHVIPEEEEAGEQRPKQSRLQNAGETGSCCIVCMARCFLLQRLPLAGRVPNSRALSTGALNSRVSRSVRAALWQSPSVLPRNSRAGGSFSSSLPSRRCAGSVPAFRAMEVFDFAAIMRDVMLPLAGQFREDKWQRAFMEDESTIALLPRLAAMSKEWRDVVATLPRYATL